MSDTARAADLTAALQDHARRHHVPGAALALLRGGEVTVAVTGVADVRTGAPVTPGTRFRGGSLMKTMAAALAVRLAAEEVVDLGGTIASQVPELVGAAWAHEALLGDVLSGRSGIPLRSATEFDATFDGPEALGLMAEAVADGPASHRFWSYSNAAWALLGRAVESQTGSSWEAVVRGRLLRRRGMDGAGFLPDAAAAVGHLVGPEGPVPVDASGHRAYAPAGQTSIVTAGDLARFASLLLDEPELGALRTESYGQGVYGWFDAWCRGMGRYDWRGGPAWGWSGLTRGQRSELRILPRQRGALALLTNASTGRAMFRSLASDLVERYFGVGATPLSLEPAPTPVADPARYVGVYGWPDRRHEVVLRDGRLELLSPSGTRLMRALDERVFVVDAADPDNPTVTFGGFDEQGRPGVLYVMLWGFPRLGGTPGSTTPAGTAAPRPRRS